MTNITNITGLAYSDGIPLLLPAPTAVVVESQSMTFTCSASSPIVILIWEKNGVSIIVMRQDCSIFGTPSYDRQLYSFNCTSDREFSWTILNVTETQHGDYWTCTVANSSGLYVDSNPTKIFVAGILCYVLPFYILYHT